MGGVEAREHQRRVRRGRRKKLRAALRFNLERKAEVDFLADLIGEEDDARAHFAGREHEAERPEEAEVKPENIFYWQAWHRLTYDRFVGSMGGEGPIYYQAVSRYAEDHRVAGSEFEILRHLISEMDSEYLAYKTEKAKEEEQRRKLENGG